MRNAIPLQLREDLKPDWCHDLYAGPARTQDEYDEERLARQEALAPHKPVMFPGSNRNGPHATPVVLRRIGEVLRFPSLTMAAAFVGMTAQAFANKVRRRKSHGRWVLRKPGASVLCGKWIASVEVGEKGRSV